MVTIAMDARGKLERLRAVPPQVEPREVSVAPPDWGPLFAAAGLDQARFSPSAPKWVPEEPFDARADWEGPGASQADPPIHVAAASWHGKPVWFAVLYPWSVPDWEIESAQYSAISDFALVIYVGGGWIAGIVLARRSLRLGRGDRRGALRVATFVFTTGILAWLFRWHHIPLPGTEFSQLINAITPSLFLALYVWLAYIAIEPIVRRRSPELLFSWSRILAGRFGDPLVGRDLLVGILGSAVVALMSQAPVVLPNWIPLSGMTPQSPSPALLLGSAASMARALELVSFGPLNALGVMTLFVFGLVVLRRRWLAAGFLGLDPDIGQRRGVRRELCRSTSSRDRGRRGPRTRRDALGSPRQHGHAGSGPASRDDALHARCLPLVCGTQPRCRRRDRVVDDLVVLDVAGGPSGVGLRETGGRVSPSSLQIIVSAPTAPGES